MPTFFHRQEVENLMETATVDGGYAALGQVSKRLKHNLGLSALRLPSSKQTFKPNKWDGKTASFANKLNIYANFR